MRLTTGASKLRGKVQEEDDDPDMPKPKKRGTFFSNKILWFFFDIVQLKTMILLFFVRFVFCQLWIQNFYVNRYREGVYD